MPGFDKTGPAGAGAKTGRGMGPCGGAQNTGGAGRGMGAGRGFGRRFLGWFRPSAPPSEDKKEDK